MRRKGQIIVPWRSVHKHVFNGAPELHWQKSFATKFSVSYTDKNGAMAKSK